MKNKTVIAFAISVLLLLITVSAAAADKALPITFNVQGDTFTAMTIEGQNENGQWRSWESPPPPFRTYAFIDIPGRWQGTINISANTSRNGWRSCVIDYLKTSYSGSVPVTLQSNGTCSGDAGGSRSDRRFVEQLNDVLDFADANATTQIISNANDVAGCTNDLVNFMRSKTAVFKITISCGGIVVNDLRHVLTKYGRGVQ